MITLIITMVLGLGFAIFATQNTGAVTLNFGRYFIPDIPLYLVILISLLMSLFFAFIIYITRDLSAKITESEMKDETKKLKEENIELTKRVHKLEIENTKLKSKLGEDFDEDSI